MLSDSRLIIYSLIEQKERIKTDIAYTAAEWGNNDYQTNIIVAERNKILLLDDQFSVLQILDLSAGYLTASSNIHHLHMLNNRELLVGFKYSNKNGLILASISMIYLKNNEFSLCDVNSVPIGQEICIIIDELLENVAKNHKFYSLYMPEWLNILFNYGSNIYFLNSSFLIISL